MNLCGERKTASLWHCGCSAHSRFISMSTYGAAAAKSQNDSAPCRCSRSAMRCVSVTMPVTLEAAENDPMRSGRSAYSLELLLEHRHVDVAVAVLGDRHDVADRLAPRQLVGVVLERADEHDRPLVGAGCAPTGRSARRGRPGCAG